jgi:hypothetical protein
MLFHLLRLGFKSLRIIVSGLLTGSKQSIETARSLAGKKFNLLNLPFYLVHRIEKELETGLMV